MTKREISILLGVVCAVLVFAICVQLKTISNSSTTVPQSLTEDSLREEVLYTKQNYDKLYQDLLNEEKELEKIRKEVAEDNEYTKEIETKIKTVDNLLGLTEITGQGVIVTLDDSKTASLDAVGVAEDLSTYLVHYVDVLKTINELWNAGAEGISVNNQRIVQTTGITCIGNVISINGQKVGAPFIINAIGDPEKLYGALTRIGSYTKLLERDGVSVDIKKATNIHLPKFSGTFSTEYIETK